MMNGWLLHCSLFLIAISFIYQNKLGIFNGFFKKSFPKRFFLLKIEMPTKSIQINQTHLQMSNRHYMQRLSTWECNSMGQQSQQANKPCLCSVPLISILFIYPKNLVFCTGFFNKKFPKMFFCGKEKKFGKQNFGQTLHKKVECK